MNICSPLGWRDWWDTVAQTVLSVIIASKAMQSEPTRLVADYWIISRASLTAVDLYNRKFRRWSWSGSSDGLAKWENFGTVGERHHVVTWRFRYQLNNTRKVIELVQRLLLASEQYGYCGQCVVLVVNFVESLWGLARFKIGFAPSLFRSILTILTFLAVLFLQQSINMKMNKLDLILPSWYLVKDGSRLANHRPLC